MKKHVLFAILLFATSVSFAQPYLLSGKITDNQNKPIGFVSVYIRNSTYGTTANENGRYQFKLTPGTYDVIYRYVGFIEQIEKITITNHDVENSIRMAPEVFQLAQVNITARRHGPADSIMRKVISKRKFYLNEVPEYSCVVYVKGVQRLIKSPKKLLGFNVTRALELDTNGRGILYQSESLSKLSFGQPDKIKEVMIASKLAGQSTAFSYNKASDLLVNFYKNSLVINGVSSRAFVSPLADNARAYYNFRLAGVSVENGRRIDKIEVLPKHEHDAVYRGFIYILEGKWRIYSVDLMLTKKADINLIDTMNISQQYIPVRDSIWLPVSVQYTYSGDVLGFKFAGYYAGVYNNYNLDPKFGADYFNGEVMRIDSTANQKDAQYWATTRPVPLTAQETRDYRKKDSVGVIERSKPFQDSLENARNRFSPLGYAISGYGYTNRYTGRAVYVPPIYQTIFYNTVEGWGLNLKAAFTQYYDNKTSLTVTPAVRYGFSNKMFEANVHVTYNYDPIKRGYWFGTFGSDVLDINNVGTRSNVFNTLSTLISNDNYVKYYRSEFGLVGYQRELSRALLLNTSVSYANRQQLYNHSYNHIFRDKEKVYSSNNPLEPFTPEHDNSLFPENQALTFKASLTVTFQQNYTTRPDGRFYEPSKFPQIRFNYRKGINAFNSDVDYDFGSFDIFDNHISTGLWGFSAFKISAGDFFNRKRLYFTDYQHFFGNQGTTFDPTIGSFHFLPFYTYSTNDAFLEAHYEHNFSGVFLNKVSFMRKLKLEEIIGANYLTGSAGRRNYAEYYIGLQRFIFRIDYGISYQGTNKLVNGIRIFYGLK